MRRNIRAFHLAEARSIPLRRRLVSQPASEWPAHARLAHAILRDELHLPEAHARQLMLESISAAQACAEAVNRRAMATVEANSRATLAKAFKCVGNCCRRAPAGLRRRLDAVIPPLLEQGAIDAEVIEAIIDAAIAEFKRSSNDPTTATALRAMYITDAAGTADNWLKNRFAGLRPQAQRRCEVALSKLGKSGRSVKAHMVFEVLKAALERKSIAEKATFFLIAGYVAVLVLVWRAAGLNPTRATSETNPAYKSKFHRFSDLVLTAVAEPWSRRHDGDRDRVQRMVRAAWTRLPKQYRQIGAGLSQADRGWLVSEHILRKGLRRRIKKSPPQTP